MRVSEKLAIVDRIARELQSRFTYDEIDSFLAEFEIAPPENVGVNSKWVYSKAALSGAPLSDIARIAEDLGMKPIAHTVASFSPPRNWHGTKDFRLFVSHIAKDKDKATRLKACLEPDAISGFVAHEDIHPTLEWQREIERALHCMDAMVAIHTPGFSNSYWTQQEIGFALGRGAKVISFKMGEDPTGFISRHQALARRGRQAEEIAEEIDTLILEDELTKDRLLEAKTERERAIETTDDIPF